MAGPESVFCKVLEERYNSIVSQIDTAITVPKFVLKSVEGAIRRVENIIVNEVVQELDALELKAKEILALIGINYLDDKREDFCLVAFSCRALVNRLFNPSSDEVDLLPFFTSAQKTSYQLNYELFRKNVCKLSFRKLINEFTDTIILEMRNLISELRTRITSALNIDHLIYRYNKALIDAGIFDLLDTLDDFAQCGFSTCNFVFSFGNKLDDVSDKLKISNDSGSWEVSLDGLLTNINTKVSEIDTRLDTIESWLDAGTVADEIPIDNLFKS